VVVGPPPPPVREVLKNFTRVNFDLDSSALTASTKSALDDNIRILREEGAITVEIQGHCDERGTTGYNMGLGDRRAAAVKKYLVAGGVPSSRISVVSYGEERPLASGEYESAWAQNRRAEFRVASGSPSAPEVRVEGTTRN